MASGLSEDTVYRTCTCQLVGGPQADGTAKPFRGAQLFMSLAVIYREQAIAYGQLPGVPGQEDGRKPTPTFPQLNTGLAVGAHTGLSPQGASHGICRTVSLLRLRSWH